MAWSFSRLALDLIQVSRSEMRNGVGMYNIAITIVLAVERWRQHILRAGCRDLVARVESEGGFTQIREHAPKDGERGGGLLV